MKLIIKQTIDELVKEVASFFIQTANAAINNKGRFSVALPGGNSPKKLFQLLSSPVYNKAIDWTKIDFFFGDERYVSPTDDASNYKQANEFLFKPLGIPTANIFAVNTSLSPVVAASDYDLTIKNYFKENLPSFDFILLGLGDNSHTASLFPFTPVLKDIDPAVKAVFVDDLQAYRITMNAPLLNLAKNIAFLVFGTDKAVAVQQVIEGEINIDLHPAQLIKPATGELFWFLDNEAAKNIKN